MKKFTIQFMLMLIIIIAFQSFLQPIWAQSPQKMSYQAVVRNSSDKLVTNKIVGMKISILKGSESGTAVYTEIQKPTTNINGLVTVEIGTGTSTGDFSAIEWAKDTYYIKTETDPTGGTNYTISGVSQLLSVPYALHARTVEIDKVDDADADPTNEIQILSKTGNTVTLSKSGGSFTDAVDDADADPTNEIQTLSISGTSLTLSKNGGTVTLPASGGGDNWGTQTVVTNATLEGNGSTATPLKIAQQAATNGQVLKWNGSNWVPGNDAAGISGLALPYSQTIANSDFAFSVTNSLNSAIKGSSTSTIGMTYGIYGNSASTNGTGVFGSNESLTGETYGVNGIASSPDGAGIFGKNYAPDGNSYGVKGTSNSQTGTGVYGYSSAGSGLTNGIKGEAISSTGNGVLGIASSATGVTYGVKGVSSSTDGWGIVGEAPRFGIKGTGGEVGLYGEASFTYGIGVQGVGIKYGIFGQGFYGVCGGSNDSEGFGVLGSSQNCGVKGEAGSDTGFGVLGFASSATGSTYGVKGYSSSSEGWGVFGEAPNNGVKGIGNYIGVSGKASASLGIGVQGIAPLYGVYGEGAYAVYGVSSTVGGYGVFGSSISCGVRGFSDSETGIGVIGNNPSGSGYTFGVKGLAGSGNGTGVYGDGGQYGVYGESSSSNGSGVYGVAESYGVKGTSTSGYGAGVYGWGAKYGVYGECPVPTGYAGYFSGHLAVTGNVGIGTTDPSYRLDVAGSINLNKGLTGGAIYCNGNEALWFDGNVFSWGFQSQLNYFARPVAIGTNSYTGYLLTVNGTAAKPGGGSWTTWSDSRLKDIQGNYEKGLKEIILLKPVKYNYKKDNACKLPSDKNYVGFIAQDVQKIFPEAVTEGKDGYLTLDVNSINVALVNAIKELKTENELLKTKNDKLESRLTIIEKIVSASIIK